MADCLILSASLFSFSSAFSCSSTSWFCCSLAVLASATDLGSVLVEYRPFQSITPIRGSFLACCVPSSFFSPFFPPSFKTGKTGDCGCNLHRQYVVGVGGPHGTSMCVASVQSDRPLACGSGSATSASLVATTRPGYLSFRRNSSTASGNAMPASLHGKSWSDRKMSTPCLTLASLSLPMCCSSGRVKRKCVLLKGAFSPNFTFCQVQA